MSNKGINKIWGGCQWKNELITFFLRIGSSKHAIGRNLKCDTYTMVAVTLHPCEVSSFPAEQKA